MGTEIIIIPNSDGTWNDFTKRSVACKVLYPLSIKIGDDAKETLALK